MKGLLFLLLVLASTGSLYSQNKIIKGRVIDNRDLEGMPFVSIIVNDTVEAGKTDLNGFFRIEIPGLVKKILLRSVGMDPAIIEIADTCDEVEVIMILSSTYDFMTFRKVDRLRMKKFKKLPALHKQAYSKGIFKTDKACFTQEFIYSQNNKKKR